MKATLWIAIPTLALSLGIMACNNSSRPGRVGTGTTVNGTATDTTRSGTGSSMEQPGQSASIVASPTPGYGQ